MPNQLDNKYPHLSFNFDWTFDKHINQLIGQCEAYISNIKYAPILPKDSEELHQLSLEKGAISTTAIEGNKLTPMEVEAVMKGDQISESREYQAVEINNIIDAFEELFKEVVAERNDSRITSDFILRLHAMVGKGLNDNFEATPGKFRDNNVIVGQYQAPDYKDVPKLMESMCNWLLKEFKYAEDKPQTFEQYVIQAIVSHLYLIWIHPFADGNGRTARLLEFYILLRGGAPSIALHLLSNHYNLTKPVYYKQIQQACATRDLKEFIRYALVGLKDGLIGDMKSISNSQLKITWAKLVYDKLDEVRIGSKEVLARRKTLLLELPPKKGFTADEIILASPLIAARFSGLSKRSIERDLSDLTELDLLVKDSSKKYSLNYNLLRYFLIHGKKDKK